MEKLNANRESKEFTKVILENAVDVIKYQFDSPLYMFDNIESNSILSQFVIDYARVLRNQIFHLIHNKSSDDFNSGVRKQTKSTLFKDMENNTFGIYGYNNRGNNVHNVYNSRRDMSHAVSCGAAEPSSLAPSYTCVVPENNGNVNDE
jgi:hypothetical protein